MSRCDGPVIMAAARALSIVNVAYPLAPVSPDAVGGAEQIVSRLDAALVAAGHRSIVVACAGSSVAGRLVETPLPAGPFDDAARAAAALHQRRAIAGVIERDAIDVVHMHGVDFLDALPAP